MTVNPTVDSIIVSRFDVPDMQPLPMLVLSDNVHSLLAQQIRSHTKGFYNHAMWMRKPGYVVSQNWTLNEQPISRYVDSKHRLKFWYNPEWVRDRRGTVWLIDKRIDNVLAESWWKRTYDFLGIIGQALRMKGLNNPKRRYCSEVVAEWLTLLEPSFSLKHPSPAEINEWCNANPQMKCAGIWDEDIDL